MRKLIPAAMVLLITPLFAQVLPTATLPYEMKFDTQPGAVIVTFSVANGQARIYLPNDLAPGDAFSGTVDASWNFLLEFAGEKTPTRAGVFHGTVPAANQDGGVPLILRDLKGQELARASIRLRTAAVAARSGVRVPGLIQAGRCFPILGAFDGDLKTSAMTIGGESVKIVAESPRKAVVLGPETLTGLADFRLAALGVTTNGNVRILAVSIAPSQAEGRKGNPAAFDLSVKGLAAIDRDVPLRVGSGYFYLRPDELPADGNFSLSRIFDGVNVARLPEAANLVIAETPEEEVSVILRTPRRVAPKSAPKNNDNATGEEHAAALRALGFDTVPVAAKFLDDFDLGSDAAYAMLALDEHRALAILFDSVPQSGENMERLALAWFLDHYDFIHGSTNAKAAHAAALRVLDRSAKSGTVTIDLALYAIGLTGGPEDFPLLRNFYDSKDRWAGVKSTHDASQAALTRLGSAPHLEALRAELAPALPQNATLPQGIRLVQALDKAGYAGSRDLAPEVCMHIGDPYVLEIDIGTDPGLHALAAISAIVDGTNPRGALASAAGRRTPEAWRAWCNGNVRPGTIQ